MLAASAAPSLRGVCEAPKRTVGISTLRLLVRDTRCARLCKGRARSDRTFLLMLSEAAVDPGIVHFLDSGLVCHIGSRFSRLWLAPAQILPVVLCRSFIILRWGESIRAPVQNLCACFGCARRWLSLSLEIGTFAWK
jgi:hypothetical protein